MDKNKSLGNLSGTVICAHPYGVNSAYYNIIRMSLQTLNGSIALIGGVLIVVHT